MSSPLSMLKKTRRIPLQVPLHDQGDRHKVPFRRNLLKECQSALADADSSDANSPGPSHALTSQVKSNIPLKKAAPPSDLELMSAMMQRVTLLEKQMRIQAQEMERKDKKISALEEKLRLKRESESKHELSSTDDLQSKCQRLQNQVHEMESFLSDYGLTWVGDRDGGDSAEKDPSPESERGLWQTGTSLGKFTMNFDLVLQRVRELNVLAGEGESVVQTTATGAQLSRKDPVQLRLYRNGIVMFHGPFRSYQDRSTQCMQDLMDGYFPSELQQRFPDGVPLEVHDRRDEEFKARLPWSKFPGEGRAVYGGREANDGVAQNPGKKPTTQQFLNRLPKVVVRAGRVIDVRDSLRATLQGSTEHSSDSVILIDTAAQQATRESGARPPSPRDAIGLKVKSEDGSHTYILNMCLSETVGRLRQYLDRQRGGGQLDYDIISTYPHRCYDDDHQTLQSCGLTTKTTLLLQKRKPANSLAEGNID
ncbi:UBX domain-containing protein 11 isoform X2 [Betta splendens]|uniref:UBX domain-containing protein 11 n=1 Tax=Betta splendens TaxID=158456 RepID=A0A8M1H2W7_BETSP|nr:UBX domain-containing protein 11 isoform X2 [Betta splendens]